MDVGPGWWRNCRPLMLQLVGEELDGRFLRFASPRLQADKELVLTAVRTALERHPSFGRKLGIKLVPPQMGRSLSDGSTGRAPSSPRMEKTQAAAAAAAAAGARGPPLFSRGYWGSRACGRHTFYVVITLALLIIASQQFRLQRNFKKETIAMAWELLTKV